MRVFISHASRDKPVVEPFARALAERGFEVWLDRWEIAPGDDIVVRINEGLDRADAGVVVFSPASRDSRWVEAEVSYLTYARIQEGKILVPVVLGNDDAWVPPLLRPLARRGMDEIEAIADALRHRRPVAPGARPSDTGRVQRVLIRLERGEGGTTVAVSIGDQRFALGPRHARVPADLQRAHGEFLQGFRTGLRRHPAAGERAALEASLVRLGHQLRDLCLPLDSGQAVSDLVNGSGVGTTVEVVFEADEAEWLGLPFEALRLPDGRLLAIQPNVVLFRRPHGVQNAEQALLAHPLKILVAVGAPDEDRASPVVLDQERELQNILDAVEAAHRHERVAVRILEVGHPAVMASAFEADAYHVLHLSCHGLPGQLELEDEDGRAHRVRADQLLEPIRRTGRPLPLVLLNACHGGVYDGHAASFAEALLRAGVPAVVAMQTSVSDRYAIDLARAFYHHLANREHLLPSRALAAARKDLEQARQRAVEQHTAPLAETQPEYATAALYVAGEERPLAEFGGVEQPLRQRPVYEVAGPVPQLRIEDLIGRRREVRETLRTLRASRREHAGVVLTGIGGVGKSAIAGRVMQRLSEEGWRVAAHSGAMDWGAISLAVGAALLGSDRPGARQLGTPLADPQMEDRLRLQFLARALAEEPVVLVLDDFEQNLSTGGESYRLPDTANQLAFLVQSAQRGRLLITCRHPLPGADDVLRRIPVGPLSPAESRKLLQRLDGLRDLDAEDVTRIHRTLGGHPRMWEFLDALLRGGRGRLRYVTTKLRELLAGQGIPEASAVDGLGEAVRNVVLLGARDVFLEELLVLAQRHQAEEILFQLAVSRLPVSVPGLARMLAGDPNRLEGDAAGVARAVARLEDWSMVHRFPDGTVWVHRWTAEGLARRSEEALHRARCARAGAYRLWRLSQESHDLADGVEAIRNFLEGGHHDTAVGLARSCFELLTRARQSLALATLAAEILESLPAAHPGFAEIGDAEAQAHMALGFTDKAMARYQGLLTLHERRVAAEPERANYQRDLSVSYDRMGDLLVALGQGEAARQAYEKSLGIRERLAASEPERADYQRDLSVSYNKVGDLFRALGQGEAARQAYEKSLGIRERLAASEPERADYQRDLSVSYERMGDLLVALGQGEAARQAYEKSLGIRERLAASEPERADYQRDLSVSYDRMGDLFRALGQGEAARQAYEKSLGIAERLAASEPERADYQRDLSVSYNKVGDLLVALGQGEAARQAYEKSLGIRERLAASEPERADYQRDLSVSYERMGDLFRALGQGEAARQAYEKSLGIRERLAASEPERADYQRDLSVSYDRMGDLFRALGQGEAARQAYEKSLGIRERLAASEPERADYQQDLAASLVRVGVLGGVEGRARLTRALSILEGLRDRGRLPPVDVPKIDVLRQFLESEGGTSP